MAIRAGRVGILPEELTPEGKMKPVSIEPAYWGKLGAVMPGDNMRINSAGVIDVNTISIAHTVLLDEVEGALKYTDDITISDAQTVVFVINTFGQSGPVIEVLTPANNNGATGYYFTSKNIVDGDLITKIYTVNFSTKTVSLYGTTSQDITTA